MRYGTTFRTYNCRDVVGEYDAFVSLKRDLEELGQLEFYRTITQPLAQAVWDMQMNGMPVDEGRKQAKEAAKQAKLVEMYEKLKPYGQIIDEETFNPNSNPQVGKMLKEFGFHTGRLTDKGALKADKEEIITALLATAGSQAEGLFGDIITYREETKDLGTFLRPIVAWPDGRVRSSFLVTTRTGRLHSRKWTTPWGIGPEFQNLPEDMRDIYCTPPGWEFVTADAMQLELVIIANEANVRAWLEAIERGDSIHIINMMNVMKVSREEAVHAKAVKDRRYITIKKFVFADNYWADLITIQRQLLIESRLLIPMPELQKIMAAYRGFITEIEDWRNSVYPVALATRCIRNRFGRLRTLFEPEDKIRGISVNHPIQSTGADFINIGFIKLHRAGLQLVNQVHDEVVTICRTEDRTRTREAILEAFNHKIPINGKEVSVKMDVKHGRCWGEMEAF